MVVKTMIKVAHAVYDENGKSVGGKAGDQNGKEVCIWDWYESGSGWTHVFRAKDKEVASKIAEVANKIVSNDCIGYSQNNRLTLNVQAQKEGYDISKITTKCDCDCSSMVAVCVNASGVKISPSIYTGNQLSAIKCTNAFTVLTDKKYLNSAEYLQDGDILFRKGHTAVAVEIKRQLKLTSPRMKGEDVKELQRLIGVDDDGVYGPDTDDRVNEIMDALGRE